MVALPTAALEEKKKEELSRQPSGLGQRATFQHVGFLRIVVEVRSFCQLCFLFFSKLFKEVSAAALKPDDILPLFVASLLDKFPVATASSKRFG